MTTCQACGSELQYEQDDNLLFCAFDDCDEFAVYPDYVPCIDCGKVEAPNPAQRCERCQRTAMIDAYLHRKYF